MEGMSELGASAASSPNMMEAREVIAFCVLTSVMQRTLEKSLTLGIGRLFTVSTEGLFDVFLSAFDDPVDRQHHSCQACRDFIRRFGGAMWLDADGSGGSALWGELDEETSSALSPAFRRVIMRLRGAVETRPVEQQLLWSERRWGHAEAGGFTHLWADVRVPAALSDNLLLTARQAMAVRREDFKRLSMAVAKLDPSHVDRAVGMLEAGGLEASRKLLPMATFLRDTQVRATEVKGEQRRRVLWAAVAMAPRGWCSLRGSVVGALIEDVAEGKSVEAITRAHDARVMPGKYQRPVAAPSAGNIAQAERTVAELGLAPALLRRPLALSEAKTFWTPPAKLARAPKGGVFGALSRGAEERPVTAPLSSGEQTMTWVKFARDVLPEAESLRMHTWWRGAYAALTTAVDADAPPIFRWDSLEERNPVSWYTYIKGSLAAQWRLEPHTYVPVLALCELPCVWGTREVPAFRALGGGRVLAVLEGAADQKASALGLFPECLRGELHPVRATIEAHSNSHALGIEDRPRASGCIIGAGAVRLEVGMRAGVVRYCIDRLE